MATGVVFYSGPSRIDGSPIVGIATFGSRNEKTGDLVQTWILRADIHPMEAINTGEDKSICGSCPLRGYIASISEKIKSGVFDNGLTTNKFRSCYVLVQNAPAQIYRCYKENKYEVLTADHSKLFVGKGLRYGSYGDPVAIPMKAWSLLEKFCTGKARPGYTHQWRDGRFKAWSKKIMASTHTLEDNELAQSKGWRTFRTIADSSQLSSNEIHCPASEEGGYKKNCENCGACNGRRSIDDQRVSIAIIAHGAKHKANFVKELSRA